MNEGERRKPKAPEWLYSNIAEASKIARRILFIYLGFVIYCVYTVVGSSDVNLFLGEPITLPILGTEVNSLVLLSIFPVVAIAVFAYIQIYVLRIRSMVCDLREDFDYSPDKRLYPWMLLIAEEPDEGAIGRLQKMASMLMIWAPLPVALYLMALWGIRRHEPGLTIWLGLLFVFGVEMVIWFRRKHVRFGRRRGRRDRRTAILSVATTQLVVCALAVLIPFIHGGRIMGLNLADAVLVVQPDDREVGLPSPSGDDWWADYSGVDLIGANLCDAVLVHADLGHADLSCSCLDGTDFCEAGLHSAVFRRAIGRGSVFVDAQLWSADFQSAVLTEADFSGAALVGACFDSAIMLRCVLKGANLSSADLRGTSLVEADLTDATLTDVDLSGADLSWAKLDCAAIQYADMRGATLDSASFVNADLRGAKGITAAQLCSVRSLYGAVLDKSLTDLVKDNCPELLAAPQTYRPDLAVQTPSCTGSE